MPLSFEIDSCFAGCSRQGIGNNNQDLTPVENSAAEANRWLELAKISTETNYFINIQRVLSDTEKKAVSHQRGPNDFGYRLSQSTVELTSHCLYPNRFICVNLYSR